MNDELDPRLLARFARAREPALGDAFLGTMLERLAAERRRARRRQTATGIALSLLLAWQLPALLAFTARLADGLVAALILPALPLTATGNLSPWAWAASLLIAALSLWRNPSLRRRR